MTTTTMPTVHARRPGPRAWMRMIQAEAKMITRSTADLVFRWVCPSCCW